MVSLPEGASPDTWTGCGPAGSLLSTVTTPDFGPKLFGAKRIGSGRQLPGATLSGYESASGTTKSAEEEMTPVIDNMHFPLLFTISGSSLKEPTQTCPKSPVLASTRLSRGAGAL